MDGYRADTYGEAFADVYDDWYGSLGDADSVVAAVSREARRSNGAVLELGVGTGRLALPLVELGHAVVGVDSSSTMLDQLRTKPGADRLELHLLDMADVGSLSRTGGFAVVFAAFNTLLNLATADDRRRCLAAAAALLAPTGLLAVEAVVPGPEPDTVEDHVEIRTMATDRLVLTVSRRDPTMRTVSGHHVDLTDGAAVRLRPWRLGYLSPTDLDREAADSGLSLARRDATWDGATFDDTSAAHVSWYRVTSPDGEA